MRNQLDCPWRKQTSIKFSLAYCQTHICTHPGVAKPAYCEDDGIPDWCPHMEVLA